MVYERKFVENKDENRDFNRAASGAVSPVRGLKVKMLIGPYLSVYSSQEDVPTAGLGRTSLGFFPIISLEGTPQEDCTY